MKNIILGTALVLGAVAPHTVLATSEDEVTIRVIEATDDSRSSVMQQIALPVKAGEKQATQLKEQEKLKKRIRNTVRVNEDNLENEEMLKERERDMEEERSEAAEQHQDHTEDKDQGLGDRPVQGPGR